MDLKELAIQASEAERLKREEDARAETAWVISEHRRNTETLLLHSLGLDSLYVSGIMAGYELPFVKTGPLRFRIHFDDKLNPSDLRAYNLLLQGRCMECGRWQEAEVKTLVGLGALLTGRALPGFCPGCNHTAIKVQWEHPEVWEKPEEVVEAAPE